jgi:hypothetical protein
MSTNKVLENLAELIKTDQFGYRLGRGYFLELKHCSMGNFPAIIKGTKRVVLVLNPEFLMEVGAILEPRSFNINSVLFYVNDRLGIGYPVLDDLKMSKPQKFLSQAEFDELTAEDGRPFEWAPGLMGPGMSRDEFRQTLKLALAKCG